jgi:hypothetical protein
MHYDESNYEEENDPFFIPMFVTDAVVAEYRASISLIDHPGNIYTKVLSTNYSRKSGIEQGFLLFKNGNKYEGAVVQGKMYGIGRLTFADGSIYEGEFTDNAMTGTGKVVWGGQVGYEGEFCKGYRHGKGLYTNTKFGITYDGDWYYGTIKGWGKLTYPNAAVYEGEMDGGQRQGEGTMYYTSGNTYFGNWTDNSKADYGTMYWKDQQQKYEGNWKNDSPEGFGK